MKKLISLFVLLFIVLGAIAQERTVTSGLVLDRDAAKGKYSYINYEGGSSDRLIYTTRDTIDYVFQVKKTRMFDVSAGVTFSPILGADTTVTIAILGRNSTNDSWNAITSGLSAVVTTDDVFKEVTTFSSYHEKATIDTLLTSGALAADAFYVTNVVYSAVGYRYINIRLILTGDDSVGTGIQVDNVELKTYEK